jgi:hypothetical protein
MIGDVARVDSKYSDVDATSAKRSCIRRLVASSKHTCSALLAPRTNRGRTVVLDELTEARPAVPRRVSPPLGGRCGVTDVNSALPCRLGRRAARGTRLAVKTCRGTARVG